MDITALQLKYDNMEDPSTEECAINFECGECGGTEYVLQKGRSLLEISLCIICEKHYNDCPSCNGEKFLADENEQDIVCDLCNGSGEINDL